MGGRRQIGIAHAEIDDVGPRIAGARLGPVHLFEHVRRQAADAVKVFHCLKPLGRLPCPAGRYDPGRLLSWVGLCAILGGGICVFLGGGLPLLLRASAGASAAFSRASLADRARPRGLFPALLVVPRSSPGSRAAAACRAPRDRRKASTGRAGVSAGSPISPGSLSIIAPGAQPHSSAARPKAARTGRTKARAIPCSTRPRNGKSMQTQ